MTETIHDVLAPILEQRRLSQKRLAKRVGCDHSYVSRILAGDRTPAMEVVAAIASALALDAATTRRLYAAAGHAAPLPADLDALCDWYLGANDGDRALVTALVERLGREEAA